MSGLDASPRLMGRRRRFRRTTKQKEQTRASSCLVSSCLDPTRPDLCSHKEEFVCNVRYCAFVRRFRWRIKAAAALRYAETRPHATPAFLDRFQPAGASRSSPPPISTRTLKNPTLTVDTRLDLPQYHLRISTQSKTVYSIISHVVRPSMLSLSICAFDFHFLRNLSALALLQSAAQHLSSIPSSFCLEVEPRRS